MKPTPPPPDRPLTEDLDDAITAADQFLRWARYHLDRPRPERVEKERVKLIAALERLQL